MCPRTRQIDAELEILDDVPAGKRVLQLRSLLSLRSYERHLYTVPRLQRVLDELLARERFDIVNVEFPYLAHYRLRQGPRGAPAPRLVLDEHNVEFDVLRQVARSEAGLGRRVYNAVNWRKLRLEEQAAWRRFDGITVSSPHDQQMVRAAVPTAQTALVPNAVDVEFFRPQPSHPRGDGRTIVFFGAINYFPNTDGILFFLREVWPRLSVTHPDARLKILGHRPPAAVLEHRGSRVDVTGFVEDLRPHLAEAAVAIAPLRLGSGTRLKILEAMAMAKAVVSTSIGAAGLDVTPGKDILIADDPAAFGAAIGRALDEPLMAGRLGQAARALVEERYSWSAAAAQLERFFREVLETPLPKSG